MTRRYGIDVSHFQPPAAPGGFTYDQISQKAQFVIARATYGAWADPLFLTHIGLARIDALQVGAYHFLCVKQSISDQLDVFRAQCCRALIGPGDILPALDIEDDGPNKISPAWAPLVKQAVDELVGEFGGVLIYCTQAGWAQMGKPAWMLEHDLWVAHYLTSDPAKSHPATPGGKAPAIWQYRVGPFSPGSAHVLGQDRLPNALDHDLADAPLPVCKTAPSIPGVLPAPGPPPPSSAEIWNQRLLDQLTNKLGAGLDEDDEPTTPNA